MLKTARKKRTKNIFLWSIPFAWYSIVCLPLLAVPTLESTGPWKRIELTLRALIIIGNSLFSVKKDYDKSEGGYKGYLKWLWQEEKPNTSIALKKLAPLPNVSQIIAKGHIRSACKFAEIKDTFSHQINDDISQMLKTFLSTEKAIEENNNKSRFKKAVKVIDELNVLSVFSKKGENPIISLVAGYLDVPESEIPRFNSLKP